MFRFTSLCFYLILILSQNKLDVSGKKDLMSYGIQDAIQDINFFIPGSKAILTTAIKIWLVFGQVEQLVNPNATHIQNSLDAIEGTLTELTDKLDNIADNLYDIKDDIKELSDIFQEMASKNIPQEQSLMRILSLFDTNIGLVNSQFNYFLQYNHPKKRKHANDTLLNYANKVVDHGLSELPAVMDKLYGILIAKPLGKSSLDMLADSRLSSAMMCNREMSAQHKINTVYNELKMAEIKNILMVEFAYSLKKTFNTENDYQTELEEAREKSFQRTSKIIKLIKKAMTNAPREFWRCDPPEHKEGDTYAKLGPVFQAYVVKEKDLTDERKEADSCAGSCSDRIKSKDACVSNYCKKKKDTCKGYVHDCGSAGNSLNVCFRDDPSTENRYKFIYAKNDKFTYRKREKFTYGKREKCSFEVEVNDNRYKNFKECDVCMCTCAADDPNMNRYFNLRAVTSEVKKNKVVTGVRMRLENQMFHIEIKQGTLMERGNVNASSNDWKPIESFTVKDNNVTIGKDYHSITYEKRTVYLDKIDSPINNAVTGLRFNHGSDYVKLEIQITPFDFETGTLNTAESTWLSNAGDTHSRQEKDIRNLDLPTSSNANKPDSKSNQYIRFTTSSLKSDVGQSVVPFIDLQPLETDPPVPISGVALIHKGDEKTSGFLAFKLSTYNYAPHLQ